MKTDVITVSAKGQRMGAALEQVEKVAAYKELSQKDALHLRLLTEEMMGMMRSITGEPEGQFWIEDEDERKARCAAALADNDRETALALIKAIRIHRDRQFSIGKKLHVADERFLKDAEKLLREEASYVLDKDPDRVLTFLTEKAQAV